MFEPYRHAYVGIITPTQEVWREDATFRVSSEAIYVEGGQEIARSIRDQKVAKDGYDWTGKDALQRVLADSMP